MQRKIRSINSLHPDSDDSRFFSPDISYLQPVMDAFPTRKMHILGTGRRESPRLNRYAILAFHVDDAYCVY